MENINVPDTNYVMSEMINKLIYLFQHVSLCYNVFWFDSHYKPLSVEEYLLK